jgi:hypothetical protein
MKKQSRVSPGAIALAAALLCLGIASSPLDAADPSMRTQPNANEVGIWKSYAPRGIQGEFNSYDPVGLMAGSLIHADCSINWRDPDTGKLYCFASGTSFNYFQDWPKTYSRRAQEKFEQLQQERPGS